MQDYLALVSWIETSLVTKETLSAGSDVFDFKAKDEDEMASYLRSLERVESLPPRSTTKFKVERVWKTEEVKFTL